MRKGEKKPKQPRQPPAEDHPVKALQGETPKPQISDLLRQIRIQKQALADWDMAFNSITDPASVHDKDFRILRVNKAFADMVGVGPEDLIGRKCHEVLHGTDEPRSDCPHKQALESRKPLIAEFWEPHVNAHLQIAVAPILDENNEPVGSIHIAKDVTDRKRAHDALRESEVRFRDLTENTSDWIWEVDDQLRYVYSSPKVFDLLGYGPEEVLGKTPWDFMPPEETARLQPTINILQREPRPFRAIENVNIRKDGSYRVLETSGVPVYNPEGKFAGFRGIDRDITDRKRAEGERENLIVQLEAERRKAAELAAEARRRADEAEEGKRTLETLMEYVPAGITIADADLNITCMSRYPQSLTGFPIQELIGAPHDIIASQRFRMNGTPVKPEDLPLHRAVRKGEIVMGEELILEALNGERFVTLVHAAPIRDSEGKIIGGVAAWSDITTLKRIQETVQNQADELNAMIISMADGVIVYDREGRVHKTNPRLCEIYGFDPAEEKLHFSDFLPNAPDLEGHPVRLEETPSYRALHGETVLNFPLKLRNRLGKDLFIQVSASPLYREGRILGAVAVIHDITREETLRQELEQNHAVLKAIHAKLETQAAALKRSRNELEQKVKERTADLAAVNTRLTEEMEERRQTEEKYRQLVTNAPVGIYEVDIPNFRILSVNEVMCAAMGYTREEFLSLSPLRFLTEEGRRIFAERQKKILAGEKVSESIEYQVRTKTGQVIWALMNGRIFYENGKPVRATVIAHDITERKQYEAALLESESRLRHLSAELLLAQEKERKNIALELHDGFAASLASIKYSLEQKLSEMKKKGHPPIEGVRIEDILAMVQNNIVDVRRLMANLRPSVLDDLGILATLTWFVREFRKTYTGIQVTCRIGVEEKNIPELLKIVIFRLLQEAMHNITQHSGADRVVISLAGREGKLLFSVQDNGRGFDVQRKSSAENPDRGLGLGSMRERVEISGGRFAIESSQENGTVIRAEWPL